MAEETRKNGEGGENNDKRKDDPKPEDMLDLVFSMATGSQEADKARFYDALDAILDIIPDTHPPIEDTDDPHEENRRKILRSLVRRVVKSLTFDDVLYLYGKHIFPPKTYTVYEEPYFERVKDLFTKTPSYESFRVDPIIHDEVMKIRSDILNMRGYDDFAPWLGDPYDEDRVKKNQREWSME